TIALRGPKLVGFNTDSAGFSRAVREEFSVDLKDLRVLVAGAGGVARAIAFECGKHGCERLVIANRDRSRADLLVKQLQRFFTRALARSKSGSSRRRRFRLCGPPCIKRSPRPITANNQQH